MQLRAMGYGFVRPKLNIDPEKKDLVNTNAAESVRNVIPMKNMEKEKPFQCTYPGCDARFPRMYNLKSHMLCHTGNFKELKFKGKDLMCVL